MKKILLILLVLVTAASFSLSAAAIGATFGLNFVDNATGNVALTGKLTELPPVFGLSFDLGSDTFRMGLTADWWMYQRPLVGMISMYVGPGAYVKLELAENNNSFGLGARVPFGFQIFPFGNDPEIELFFELAPILGVQFTDPIDFPQFSVQGVIGGRLWFDNR